MKRFRSVWPEDQLFRQSSRFIYEHVSRLAFDGVDGERRRRRRGSRLLGTDPVAQFWYGQIIIDTFKISYSRINDETSSWGTVVIESRKTRCGRRSQLILILISGSTATSTASGLKQATYDSILYGQNYMANMKNMLNATQWENMNP